MTYSRQKLKPGHIYTSDLLALVHAGMERGQATGDQRILDLSESVMSILAIVFRHPQATIPDEMEERAEKLRRLLNNSSGDEDA